MTPQDYLRGIQVPGGPPSGQVTTQAVGAPAPAPAAPGPTAPPSGVPDYMARISAGVGGANQAIAGVNTQGHTGPSPLQPPGPAQIAKATAATAPPASVAPVGGGMGGGGGAPGLPPAPGMFDHPGAGNDFGNSIQGYLKQFMANGPFGAGEIDDLNQQTAESARAQELNQREGIMRDAVSRGTYRSGSTADALAANRRAAGAQITQGARSNRVEAAKANHQARMQALGQAQQWLDSQRSWVLNSTKTDMEKQQMLASIAAGSAAIANQRQGMQMDIVRMMMGSLDGADGGVL